MASSRTALVAAVGIAALGAGALWWFSHRPAPAPETTPVAETAEPEPIRATPRSIGPAGGGAAPEPPRVNIPDGGPLRSAFVPGPLQAHAAIILQARSLVNAHRVEDGVSLLLNRAEQLPPVEHDQLTLFAARIWIGAGDAKRAEELTTKLEAASDPAVARDLAQIRSQFERLKALEAHAPRPR